MYSLNGAHNFICWSVFSFYIKITALIICVSATSSVFHLTPLVVGGDLNQLQFQYVSDYISQMVNNFVSLHILDERNYIQYSSIKLNFMELNAL